MGYEITDPYGYVELVEIPNGIRISSSDPEVEFKSNGSVSAVVSMVLETDLPNERVERWTVNTSVSGVSKAVRSRH